ncbi:MAG: ABC transporter substrate-binding protein [Armatimonadota bacterium]
MIRLPVLFIALALLVAPVHGAGMPLLKVGFVAPLTGVFAPTGRDLIDGYALYLEQTKQRWGGRGVVLIQEDDQFSPVVALTKVRKLIESDRVEVLTGIINSAAAYAMREYIDSKTAPTVISVAGGDDLTQRLRAKFSVRTGWGASSQTAQPLGDYAYRVLNYRRVATFADDFAFGHEWVGGFQRTFEDLGGRVVQKQWTPLGTADFTPFLARIPRDVDAVVAAVVGPIALRFIRQYADLGLRGRIPLVGPGHMTDEINLPQMGEEVVGMLTVLHYSAALQNPANRKFVEAYTKRFGRGPSAYSEAGYTAALWMDRALRRTGGLVADKDAFMAAMSAQVIAEAPRGPVRLDRSGNVVQNVYVRRVDRVGGALQNTVIHTFPTVSQFWTFDPEAFLRAAVYSRDNPRCRFCE